MGYKDALLFFGLDESYTESDLRKKLHNLVKIHHPDLGSDDSEMKKINSMYNILLTEVRKRKLNQDKELLRSHILKLKEKYKDKNIADICDEYEQELRFINDKASFEKLRDSFNETVTKFKSRIVLPLEKEKLLDGIKKYFTNYSSEVLKVVLDYKKAIENSQTIEELNTIKQVHSQKLTEVLKNEKQRVKELDNLKESYRKSQIYYFYMHAKNMKLNDIFLAYSLLISILKLIDKMNFHNYLLIVDLIENIKYDNLDSCIAKYQLYVVENISTKELSEVNLDRFTTIDNNFEFDDSRIINLILDKLYVYAISKKITTEKLEKEYDTLKEIFGILQEMDSSSKEKLLSFGENLNYKVLKLLIPVINDFCDKDSLFIDRTTGNICVINDNNKKTYVIYLDGSVDNIDDKDIKFKFISLKCFFDVATFSNGKVIEAVDNNHNRTQFVDYNTIYLYYTNQLMLCFIDDGNTQKFDFLVPIKDSYFEVGESDQIGRNDNYISYFADKNKCIDTLLYFIKNGGQLVKKDTSFDNEKIKNK